MEIAVSRIVDPLILDLLEWVAKAPRSYADVMEAWRTSCPRLTVWEDAVDNGFLVRERVEGRSVQVAITPQGQRFLADNGRLPAPADKAAAT
jgi:predicted transcriptional regulator